MARTITGTLLLPDETPARHAKIYLTAKRSEPTSILDGVTTFFKTDENGVYSQSVVDGYYDVSVEFTANPLIKPARRWPVGVITVETDAVPVSLNSLMVTSTPPDDTALILFKELRDQAAVQAELAAGSALAAASSATDAQVSADSAAASAASITIGTGPSNIPNTSILDSRLGTTGNLGTMARQNAGDVVVTGGSIQGVQRLQAVPTSDQTIPNLETISPFEVYNPSLGYCKLIAGIDNTAGVSYIQSMAAGVSYSGVPLALMPNGGNVVIADGGVGDGSKLFVGGTISSNTRISAPQFNPSLSTGASNLDAGLRWHMSGNYNYGVGVSSASGGLEYHSCQGGAGSHRWYNGDWDSPQMAMHLSPANILSVSGGFQPSNTAVPAANVLDWYEEGTFTPTIGGNYTYGSASYTEQRGRYTRVGNLVTCHVTMGWNTHSGSGHMVIQGWPFITSAAPMSSTSSVVVCEYINFGNNCTPAVSIYPNSLSADVYTISSTGAPVSLPPIVTVGFLSFSLTYVTD